MFDITTKSRVIRRKKASKRLSPLYVLHIVQEPLQSHSWDKAHRHKGHSVPLDSCCFGSNYPHLTHGQCTIRTLQNNEHVNAISQCLPT